METATNIESQGGLLKNGLLSKAIDTALDFAAIKMSNPNAQPIGSVYPTGQSDPAAVASAKQTAVQVKENDNTYLKYALIGGGILAAIVVIVKIAK